MIVGQDCRLFAYYFKLGQTFQTQLTMNSGVLIIGPSGSGKTTLTAYLAHLYAQMDIPVTLVNLDFANEQTQNKYTPHIDINDLIRVQDVMEEFGIGYSPPPQSPNGAMLYCMQFLQQNVDWLIDQLRPRLSSNKNNNDILLFDLPGQIQLYMCHDSLKKSIQKIKEKLGIEMCVVQLFDSTYIGELKHYLSLCMMALSSVLNFELPHINVLSKIDLLKGRKLQADLMDYLTAGNPKQLVELLSTQKESHILTGVANVLENFSEVSFIPLSINNLELVSKLIFEIEKCTGSLYTRNHQPKFKQLMDQYYKDCPLFNEQMLLELEDELFKQDQEEQINRKQEYQRFIRQIQEKKKHPYNPKQ